MSEPLLRAQNLVKHFPVRTGLFGRARGAIQAVDDISFELNPGETLALVGESGCGKSTTGRALLGLVPWEGDIRIDGRPTAGLGDEARCLVEVWFRAGGERYRGSGIGERESDGAAETTAGTRHHGDPAVEGFRRHARRLSAPL
jgi:ABC-type oligopeptide transport system ATPase subunit